jgi:hypothetical protein
MVEYNLSQTVGAGANVFGTDWLVRTGGIIDPNPPVTGPVINTNPTERMRITSGGTVLFNSTQVSVPSGTGNAFYFGVPDSASSWRIVADTVNNLLIFQHYDTVSYVTKFQINT